MWVGTMSEHRVHRVVLKVGVRVGAAVACGIITTIAVAWGSAAFVRLSDGELGFCELPRMPAKTRFTIAEVRTRTATRRGCTCLPVPEVGNHSGASFELLTAYVEASHSFDPRAAETAIAWGRSVKDIVALGKSRGGYAYWLGDARGWPRRAFWCEMKIAQNSVRVSGVAGAIALPYPAMGDALTFRALPYRPIWSGLVIDSALFGAAWSVLLLFRPARARLRTRRGHCPRCNYSLAPSGGAAAGCPECGWGR
jgi:hypothetical protein